MRTHWSCSWAPPPSRSRWRTSRRNPIVFALLLSSGCARGRFVGTSFVPTQLYDGAERPEAEIATISWGKQVTSRGAVVLAPLLGIDGTDCSKVNSVLSASPGVSRCTQIVQVAPGVHSLTGFVRTPDHVMLSAGGSRSWRESKQVTIEGQELRAGYVYSLVPDLDSGGPAIRLVELCRSEDHIETAKLYMFSSGWTRTCR